MRNVITLEWRSYSYTILQQTSPTLFPYTTLFRSHPEREGGRGGERPGERAVPQRGRPGLLHRRGRRIRLHGGPGPHQRAIRGRRGGDAAQVLVLSQRSHTRTRVGSDGAAQGDRKSVV